jgi:hypothetical protein
MDNIEFTWELIKDNFEQARSHEEMREKTVTLTMTIASVLVASLAIDGFAKSFLYIFGYGLRFQTVVGLMLCGLGVFGALCSQKHYERNRMHVKLAQRFIAALQTSGFALPFDVSVEFEAHTKEKDWKASWAERIKLNWLWTGFPIFIAVIGLVLAIGA